MQTNTDSVELEWKCENMTPFGCKARDTAKELMLQELVERSDTYLELSDICKEQCCYGCNKICGYRCGRVLDQKGEP